MLEALNRIAQAIRQTKPQNAALLDHYKQLRKAGMALNNRLVETVSKDVLQEGARKLGLLRRNQLVLNSEDELAVLFDYCLHDVTRKGINAIDRMAIECPPTDLDEIAVLKAKQNARYSLFLVESREPGIGVHAVDLLRNEKLLLVDVGFSQSAQIGVVLATRLITPDDIAMTTGTPLPVGILRPDERLTFVEQFRKKFPGVDFRNMTPEQSSNLATQIIRESLRRGAANQVRYAEPGETGAGAANGDVPIPMRAAPRIGRNEQCGCGSGLKFKKCCGRK